MAHQFCDHLDEYGAQYTVTEASYRQCVHLLDQIMSDGPNMELVGLVTQALHEWAQEDQKLREMLVAEVRAGRVMIPRGILRQNGQGNATSRRWAKKKGHPVCTECRLVVPRLTYPEWKIAHNGEALFRGEEFKLPQPVAH